MKPNHRQPVQVRRPKGLRIISVVGLGVRSLESSSIGITPRAVCFQQGGKTIECWEQDHC
jgi:hypothetical protein